MIAVDSKAQSNIEVFGQNRIQTRKFDWKFFDTKHFRVYHYDRAGRQLGRYVAEEAENNISVIEKKLGGQFPHRFNIVLYNSYEEYRETNIGLKDESQLTENTRAGTLNLVGDKLVVYFTGKHTDLRHQIRYGMAKVVMERMMFGDNFKKMVKNALLLSLPEWVTEGYITYLVDGWDAEANSKWKSLLDARPGAGFYELSEEYPGLAGKAFWKFVATQYGNSTVKNLLYTMQLKTSLNKAMLQKENLGLKVTKAYDSCIKFYKKTYALDAKMQEMPDSTKGLISLKVPKDNTIVRNIKLSPRGSDVSYVAWKEGKFTVYTQKTSNEQEQSVLLEGGRKDLTEEMDPDYPMLAWSNTGTKLAILYKKGGETCLRIYNSIKGKIDNYVIPDNRFDRVLGITFMDDDDKLVFSAIRKSQTDLYLFTIKGTKMTNITDDEWDDIAPVYVSGGSRTGILFLSNRPRPNINVPVGVNELPTRPMNVFFYNTKTGSKELLQCTDFSFGHVSQPIQYGLENFAFLYDGNGVNNKYVVLFARDKRNKDSAYSVPITNYAASIISHQYNIASGEAGDVIQYKDKYRVYFHELQMPGENAAIKNLQPTTLSREKTDVRKVASNDILSPAPIDEEAEDSAPQLTGGNTFQSEFSDTLSEPKKRSKHKVLLLGGNSAAPDSSILAEITDSAYVKMKPSPYKLNFKPDFLQVRLDNSLLFSQYQAIATNGGSYNNTALGALTTLSLNEMMENHRITTGFQLPIDAATSNTSTYFAQYQNFTHRLDWGVLFLRNQDNKKTMLVAYEDPSHNVLFTHKQLFKTSANMIQADLSYPLDRLRSFRFHTAMRQDRLVEKTTDTLSLAFVVPSVNMYTSFSRIEYVFDNTISPLYNIRLGCKYKIYLEYLNSVNEKNKSCYNFGLDFRNYQKIYKNFILANRVGYAHSDGTSEVEYLLGGVDNWIRPQKDSKGSGAPDAIYGFQTLATSLRGYRQSAFTGNNYALLSTELRLPVTNTFVKRPIKSQVLKNLQAVAFTDIGVSWKGFIPNHDAINATYTFPNVQSSNSLNNVFVTVSAPGFGIGYGAGIRTSVFGYFLRLDAAWNMDGKIKPVAYLALGTDF